MSTSTTGIVLFLLSIFFLGGCNEPDPSVWAYLPYYAPDDYPIRQYCLPWFGDIWEELGIEKKSILTDAWLAETMITIILKRF